MSGWRVAMRVRLAGLLTPDRRTILSNSAYIVGTTVATAVLGFAYWWVAARRFTPHEVGVAATAVSAMTLLGFVGMLGFGTLLVAEIHRRGDRAIAYISTGLAVSGTAGVLLGVVAILGAPLFSGDLAAFARDPSSFLLFPLGVGLTASTLVADQALIGLLRSDVQFVRNAVFAVAKLALLALVGVVAAGASATAIFGTWVAGLLVSAVYIGVAALRIERRISRYRPDGGVLRGLGGSILTHHALNMAVQAPSMAMTVVVTSILGATTGGYYYVASMFAGFISMVGPALSFTLFAVGARSPELLGRSMRMTLALSFLVTGGGVIVVVAAGPWLLGAFGRSYASEANVALVFLSLATLPGIVKSHFVQVQRVRGHIGRGALFAALGAVGEVAAATLGALVGGLVGLSEAFAFAVLIEAMLMGPSVLDAADLLPGSSARARRAAPTVAPEPGREV